MAMKGFMARMERGVANASAIPGASAAASLAEPREPMPPSAPVVRTVAPSTSVDVTTELEGTLRCRETLRIDGRIRGAVSCEKVVLVGQAAQVHASIEADEVQVSGIVEGDITARRKITLEKTAVVVGNLATPGIVIEEGAKLKGQIVIGADAETASQPSRKPKAAKSKPDEARPSQPSPPPAVA